jgi:2'-5' RNA ligase
MTVLPAPAPRLFLALWPDDGARKGLADWRDRWTWPPGAAPTRTANLHLTLHFLGPVALDRLEALRTDLSQEAAVTPFALDFGRAELWPQGIAVVCPLATPPSLAALHARLAQRLRGLALPVDERPFKPHVTMARKAGHAALPPGGPALSWQVLNGFALVQSTSAGQDYTVLKRFG